MFDNITKENLNVNSQIVELGKQLKEANLKAETYKENIIGVNVIVAQQSTLITALKQNNSTIQNITSLLHSRK